MKIAYIAWNDKWDRNLSSMDVRKLQGVICPTHSMDYDEDLVWTNLVTCKTCKIPHFGTRWRWIKSKDGRVYVPMNTMKAKQAPAYIRDVIRKLKRKIKGRTPATPHIMYHKRWYEVSYILDPKDVVEFGVYCVFERFPRGYEPDKSIAAFFPESI
jgi:hypothetical protein